MGKNKFIAKNQNSKLLEKRSVNEDDWPEDPNDLNAGKDRFTLRIEIIYACWAGGRNCRKGLVSE